MNLGLIEFLEKNERLFSYPAKTVKTAREILYQSELPYLPLDEIKAPYETMLKEALNLEWAAVAHRSGGEHKGWKSLAIHGLSSVHTMGAEQYGLDPSDQHLYHWTDIARFAPVTTEFFKEQFKYDRYQRIRFMYMEPGGYILPHQDADKYFLGPKNIALNNPKGCRFVMEGVGVLPFYPGRVIKLALVNRHAVINDSNETRVHIIVHGTPQWSFWEPHYLRAYEKMRSQAT